MISKFGPALGLTAAIGMSLIGFSTLPRESILSTYSTPLGGRTFSQRHNALMALRAIDDCLVRPGDVFSFNKLVGSFSRDRGFRKAPVSYNGELIDDWGGGVCQTSTTTYNAALLAGMQILERTHHRFCPSYVPPGRDAAVAFPSIDLKFRNPLNCAVRVHAFIDVDKIRVDLIALGAARGEYQIESDVQSVQRPATFFLGKPGHAARIRNSGKNGYDVAVYRVHGETRELISHDSYPAMNRIVQYKSD